MEWICQPRQARYEHFAVAECGDPEVAEDYLPIIHLVFANLKTWLIGIHHGVSHQHLQAYLNEFTFRFNRRFYPFNAFPARLCSVRSGNLGSPRAGVYPGAGDPSFWLSMKASKQTWRTSMRKDQDSAVEALVEQLIEGGSENMATVFAGLFNLAMRIERERFLGAGHYERTPERRGYANGTRPKKIDTPAGTVRLEVPKTAGHEAPFYPQALERGRRSCRAVMLAVAEMYIKGVSTRDAEAVMREFGLESLSSSQVSRAAKLLDGELDAWRNRPLGEIRYLLLDARYEKVREGGVVRDAAVLSVIGIGPDQRRRVLGVSSALSEAEVHWRAFLETLVARGMRGVAYIVSDDHPGLGAARKAVLGGAVWQRCQYHLAQNAIHHAPNLAIRKAIGKELRRVWNAADGKAAEAELGHLVAAYRDSAPKLADWLETAIPEGLAVFALPERHQKRMRTSNPMERSIQQEIKRRTVKVRVFPNEASLERLVTAILVEIDEKWETTEKPYITWKAEDD